MDFTDKCVVDTNVAKTANLSNNPASISDDLVECVSKCVNAIDNVIKNNCLVIDAGDEIFDEYRRQLSMSGQPGIGDRFMKWVHDRRFQLPADNLVTITKNNDSYVEFPEHPGLTDFDLSDRKFVAVANAHSDKPPILQATDSKWLGWREALEETGITVHFLCPDYINNKFSKKFPENEL